MRMQILIMAALITAVPLAGCATMTGSSRGSVAVTSEPAGAGFTIADSSGKVTPANRRGPFAP